MGEKIKKTVDNGKCVDEVIVSKIIEKKLKEILKQKQKFILDGFPRTISSFTFLHNFLEKNSLTNDVCFLQLIANDSTCLKRILNRVICPKCFMVYTKSKVKDNCKKCNTSLVTRKADTQEIAKQRLTYFHETIEPILNHVSKWYKTKRINTNFSHNKLESNYEEIIKKL